MPEIEIKYMLEKMSECPTTGSCIKGLVLKRESGGREGNADICTSAATSAELQLHIIGNRPNPLSVSNNIQTQEFCVSL